MRTKILGIALASILAAGCGGSDDDYVDHMAEEHKDDQSVASPAAEGEPAAPVEAQRLIYANLEGQHISGYFAKPPGAGEGTPGIVMIHEWWGLNENIESMARQLAGEGFAALAVDLYGGEVARTASAPRNC